MTEQAVLVVRRVIAAPIERVFAAWTTPELLRVWWGPAGVTCIAADVELRVGGSYRLGNQLPDGNVVWIAGTFEQVEPPRRLAYTWQVGDAPVSLVTVDFIAQAHATEVIVTHARVHAAAVRDDHERGWIGCLDKLAAWSQRA
jgi:uncharacterized protein YndB with AHSA1/START domain